MSLQPHAPSIQRAFEHFLSRQIERRDIALARLNRSHPHRGIGQLERRQVSMAWEPDYVQRASRTNVDSVCGLNANRASVVLDEESSRRLPRHRSADVDLAREAPVRFRIAQIPYRRWRG